MSAIRGTGHSEGCFEVASDREVEDLYDMVDYFSKAEWSNGAVATGGKSYDSTTQNGMIAKMPHAALKAAFHVSGITDMYAYNYKNGVPYANGITFTPRYAQTYGSDGEHPQGEPFGTLDAHGCQEMAEHVASGTGSAASGQKDAYWIERDWTRYIAESKWEGSIFFVHGFQDWNVKPDHILPWIDNLPQQIRVKGWLHQDTVNGGHVYPMRADWNATFRSWLDAELKGFHNEFWDGAAWQIEATDGIWRDMEAWPPTRGEGLAPSASVSSIPGPAGQAGEVTMTFTMPGPVRLTGAPRLLVQASVTDQEGILSAVLYRASGGTREQLGEGVLRAIYAGGLDEPQPVTPGIPSTFTFDAYPLDVVFEAGDELLVILGAAPQYSITTDAQLRGVVYDGEGSRIKLSLADVDEASPQPRETPCFAC